MELRQLRYFVAAAEEIHFGRAAQRLHITQPALGQQIKELELELGVELFERLPRGVRLSVAGRAMLSDARHLLDAAQRTAERVKSAGRGEAGTLRIGHVSPAMLQGSVANALIPAFCVRYPGVEVETFDLTTAELCGRLGDGRLDAAIFFTVADMDFGFPSEVLGELLLTGVLLPATHPLAERKRLRCEDLSALPCLSPPGSTSHGVNAALLDELRARGATIRVSEHQVSDVAMRVGLVASGAGFLPCEARAVEWLATTPGVVFREWAEAPIRFPCSVFWRPEDRSAVVANLVAIARELRRP